MKRISILLFALISAGPSSSAQTPAVINLSHDLTTYGIASLNMVPDSPSLDSRPLFQAAVTYASKHQIPLVTADRGSYYFLTENSAYQHVFLSAITNVTKDLQYSDLYFALCHGAQPQYDGLDQVNVYVPRSLARAGEVPVVLTVDGISANVVTVNIK